jgi:hypothetical protein
MCDSHGKLHKTNATVDSLVTKLMINPALFLCDCALIQLKIHYINEAFHYNFNQTNDREEAPMPANIKKRQ